MFRRLATILAFITLAFSLAGSAMAADPNWRDRIKSLAGKGAVMVVDGEGKTVLAINEEKSYIPASILKVVVAAAALEALRPDYRFPTDFRLSKDGDLYMVGYGDPSLVSEELAFVAGELKAKGLVKVRHIFLDNSFFVPNLVLDGTERSLNPYDAFNGALCVNFNTIYARIAKDGTITSAESQTPLTDMARELAGKSGAKGKVRFNLAENPETCLMYAGDLFKKFLEQAGIEVVGQVRANNQDTSKIPLFYRHLSRKTLPELIFQLFKYSNNYMTNQVFLAMGAEKYGPPADPPKARRVVGDFLENHGIPGFYIEEGSGLSRRTKVTAVQMTAVLNQFKPYRHLMVNEGHALYKTGTLRDVKTMAGYLEPGQGAPFTFVILLNGAKYTYKTRSRILNLLEENLL